MPADAWKQAQRRDIRTLAQLEFASLGRTSFPHVWYEPDHTLGTNRDDAGDDAPRRAVWQVIDRRGRVVATFRYCERRAATRLTDRHNRREPGHTVVLSKVPLD